MVSLRSVVRIHVVYWFLLVLRISFVSSLHINMHLHSQWPPVNGMLIVVQILEILSFKGSVISSNHF